MLFTWVAFRRRSSIKETVGIYGWKSNLVLLMRSSHPLLLLFPWRWTVTCTYTLEMRSNSFVIACVCALRVEGWSGSAALWFSVLEWRSDVIVPLRFQGYWDEVTKGQDNLGFIAPTCPPTPSHTPPSLKHYLSSPYVSHTEVAPHPFPLSPGLDSKHALFKPRL